MTQALKLLSVGAWAASLKVSWNPIVLVPPWRLTAKPEEDPVTGAAAWTLVCGNGRGGMNARVRVGGGYVLVLVPKKREYKEQ